MKETDRGRKVPLDGITLGPTETWVQVEYSKGGKPDGGRRPEGDGRVDERWRRAGRATSRWKVAPRTVEVGGEKKVQREI